MRPAATTWTSRGRRSIEAINTSTTQGGSSRGVVRDVSLAHFTKHGPPTILVSSADTYLYQIDPAGRQLRKDQLTGIYFNVDHGERPWGLYCTRAVDADADGSRLMSSSTSIGDVTFGLGDLNGDGRQEIVHGSSTGDLIAVDLKNTTLWRFDNYGYPVHRIRCAEVNGDGRPEVLIASGTGYVYCLDAQGAPRWQRRLGLAVHDLVLADGLIVAGTEDGEIHALDGSGNLRWTRSGGAAVRKLSAISLGGRSAVIAGLADGRLLALPTK